MSSEPAIQAQRHFVALLQRLPEGTVTEKQVNNDMALYNSTEGRGYAHGADRIELAKAPRFFGSQHHGSGKAGDIYTAKHRRNHQVEMPSLNQIASLLNAVNANTDPCVTENDYAVALYRLLDQGYDLSARLSQEPEETAAYIRIKKKLGEVDGEAATLEDANKLIKRQRLDIAFWKEEVARLRTVPASLYGVRAAIKRLRATADELKQTVKYQNLDSQDLVQQYVKTYKIHSGVDVFSDARVLAANPSSDESGGIAGSNGLSVVRQQELGRDMAEYLQQADPFRDAKTTLITALTALTDYVQTIASRRPLLDDPTWESINWSDEVEDSPENLRKKKALPSLANLGKTIGVANVTELPKHLAPLATYTRVTPELALVRSTTQACRQLSTMFSLIQTLCKIRLDLTAELEEAKTKIIQMHVDLKEAETKKGGARGGGGGPGGGTSVDRKGIAAVVQRTQENGRARIRELSRFATPSPGTALATPSLTTDLSTSMAMPSSVQDFEAFENNSASAALTSSTSLEATLSGLVQPRSGGGGGGGANIKRLSASLAAGSGATSNTTATNTKASSGGKGHGVKAKPSSPASRTNAKANNGAVNRVTPHQTPRGGGGGAAAASTPTATTPTTNAAQPWPASQLSVEERSAALASLRNVATREMSVQTDAIANSENNNDASSFSLSGRRQRQGDGGGVRFTDEGEAPRRRGSSNTATDVDIGGTVEAEDGGNLDVSSDDDDDGLVPMMPHDGQQSGASGGGGLERPSTTPFSSEIHSNRDGDDSKNTSTTTTANVRRSNSGKGKKKKDTQQSSTASNSTSTSATAVTAKKNHKNKSCMTSIPFDVLVEAEVQKRLWALTNGAYGAPDGGESGRMLMASLENEEDIEDDDEGEGSHARKKKKDKKPPVDIANQFSLEAMLGLPPKRKSKRSKSGGGGGGEDDDSSSSSPFSSSTELSDSSTEASLADERRERRKSHSRRESTATGGSSTTSLKKKDHHHHHDKTAPRRNSSNHQEGNEGSQSRKSSQGEARGGGDRRPSESLRRRNNSNSSSSSVISINDDDVLLEMGWTREVIPPKRLSTTTANATASSVGAVNSSLHFPRSVIRNGRTGSVIDLDQLAAARQRMVAEEEKHRQRRKRHRQSRRSSRKEKKGGRGGGEDEGLNRTPRGGQKRPSTRDGGIADDNASSKKRNSTTLSASVLVGDVVVGRGEEKASTSVNASMIAAASLSPSSAPLGAKAAVSVSTMNTPLVQSDLPARPTSSSSSAAVSKTVSAATTPQRIIPLSPLSPITLTAIQRKQLQHDGTDNNDNGGKAPPPPPPPPEESLKKAMAMMRGVRAPPTATLLDGGEGGGGGAIGRTSSAASSGGVSSLFPTTHASRRDRASLSQITVKSRRSIAMEAMEGISSGAEAQRSKSIATTVVTKDSVQIEGLGSHSAAPIATAAYSPFAPVVPANGAISEHDQRAIALNETRQMLCALRHDNAANPFANGNYTVRASHQLVFHPAVQIASPSPTMFGPDGRPLRKIGDAL